MLIQLPEYSDSFSDCRFDEAGWLNILDELIGILEYQPQTFDINSRALENNHAGGQVFSALASFLGVQYIGLIGDESDSTDANNLILHPSNQKSNRPLLYASSFTDHDFTPLQRHKLHELAGHFYFWLEQSSELDGARKEAQKMYESLEYAPTPFAILDNQLMVLFLNKPCREMLDANCGIYLKGRRMISEGPKHLSLHAVVESFHQQQAQCYTRLEAGDYLFELKKLNPDRTSTGSGASGLRDRVSPLWPDHAHPDFNILLSIHSRKSTISSNLLKELPESLDRLLDVKFGMTNKERRLAWNVGSGMSAQQYALLSARSVDTIRTQLKSVYRKLGAKDQKNLCKKISELMLLENWREMESRMDVSAWRED